MKKASLKRVLPVFAMAAVVLGCAALPSELLAQTTQPSPTPSKYFPYHKGDISMIVGDSIGGPHDVDPMLCKALPDLDLLFLHASIGTQDIRDAWSRMERDLIRGDLGGREVQWYFIMFGANDAGRENLVKGGYESYYRQVITTLKRRTRAHVVPICMTPWGSGTPTLAGFCDVLHRLGSQYGLKVVDLYNPSIDFIKQHGQATFSKDGGHPSPEGHKFMASEVLKQMEFEGVSEQVTVDLKTGQAQDSDGCTVVKHSPGATTLSLRNLYDFAHTVALELKNNDNALDVWVNGKKADVQDGRILVTLPEGIAWVADDLKDIQAAAGNGKIFDAAQGVLDNIAASQTLKVELVAAGQNPPAAIVKSGPSATEQSLSLARDVLSAPAASGKNAKLIQVTESFTQQFCDLRLNYPISSIKDMQRSDGVFPGVRYLYGITRLGNAAAHPTEKFQAIFTNFDCPSVWGTFSVKLPAKGWQAKPLGPMEFKDLKPGKKFVCEFELTGEDVASYEGEMVISADYDAAGIKLHKQEVFKLFAPWLGIGAFCDKKEAESGTYAEKIATVYPPEEKIDPAAVYKRYDGKEIKWQPFRSFYGYPGIERTGEVCWSWQLPGANITPFNPWPLGPAGRVPDSEPIYIAKWIYSPQDRDVTLVPVFTSRAAKMWFNGKIVVDVNDTDEKHWSPADVGMNWNLVTAFLPEKPKTVDAKLKKGWNTVLYKFLLNTCMTGVDKMNLIILDKDRKPIPDLLGSCSPQQ